MFDGPTNFVDSNGSVAAATFPRHLSFAFETNAVLNVGPPPPQLPVHDKSRRFDYKETRYLPVWYIYIYICTRVNQGRISRFFSFWRELLDKKSILFRNILARVTG